jgi:hypothetical protein
MQNLDNEEIREFVSKHRSKRSKGMREQDLVYVSKLWLDGKTHQDIANELSLIRPYRLSRSMISKDIALILERWREESLKNAEDHVLRELARIDRVEAEAWAEWERSKKDFERVEQIVKEDETGTKQGKVPSYSRKEARKLIEGRLGNDKYLTIVQKCIEQRCKLLGLNAPERFGIDWRIEAERMGLDMSDVEKQFNEMVEYFVNSPADERGESDDDE